MNNKTRANSTLSSIYLLTLIIIFLNTSAFSESGVTGIAGSTANWTDGSNAATLANQIQGEGLTITNPVVRRGNGKQVGIFSNGIGGARLEIDKGIILTAMDVKESFTTNNNQSTRIDNVDITPDPDLLAIDNRARYDTVVLEFDVTLDNNTRLLLIEYQFASEEYNEYVGTIYNDAFGFFLSGGDLNQTYNIARVVDSSVKMTTETIQAYDTVTVNNVNNGVKGSVPGTTPWKNTNTAYFIDNVGNNSSSATPVSSPIRVEYDGLTHKLQAAVDNLTPGVTYHFKMALADTGDSSWDTGVFVNKIVGIREPSFCYDYSYSQNGKYFTNNNNGSSMPYIEGSILPHDDINVTVYLRNEEVSEVLAYDITMDITDINTTQAIYKRNSTYIVNTGEVIAVNIPDASISVSDSNITNIPYEDLGSKSYAYLYYGLTPDDINDINISLNAQVSYDVKFDIGGGNYIDQHYDSYLSDNVPGRGKIPMCSGDITKYEVDWGIFNVVSKDLYNKNNPKYNIPTQVVKQPEDMLVLAHNVNDPNYINEVNSTILVGVDLIDAGKFHSVKASCDEPTSALSPIIWMAFKDKSSIDLKQEIATAISDERINLSSVSDYYPEARQNAAYRISYITTNDINASLVDTSPGTGGSNYLKLNNFTQLVQDIGTCKQPVRKFIDKDLTTMLVPVACANAGNKGLSPFEYQRCMECLFGYNTSHICSRDNFAIRPESFNVKIKDQNQLNKTLKKSFATDRTGVASPNNTKIDIASGYDYEVDINATNHIGNSASIGYTRYFSTTPSTDHNISFVWNNDKNSTICNDVTSKVLALNIVNGTVVTEINTTNVGVYKLNIIDKGWTKADQLPIIHHGGAKASYFLQTNDCVLNSSIVTSTGSDFSVVGMNGCDINSNNHDNSDANLKYRDYNITVHPYSFDLSGIVFSTRAANVLDTSFIYTANVDDNDSNAMSFHSNGLIRPRGYNNIIPSNYVAECYANDVNITMDGSIELNTTSYRVRFIDFNSTGDVTDDFTNDSNNSINNDFTTLSISKDHFSKDNSGAMDVRISMNYERNITTPINPSIVEFRKLDINCADASECQLNADLLNDYNVTGENNFADMNITHYYGRVHAPDYRFDGSPGNADIFYEAYCKDCNKTTYSVTGAESVDSIYWYVNSAHNSVDDGNVSIFDSLANSVDVENNSPVAAGLENSKFTSTSVPETPNKDRILMSPAPWLLFNLANNLAVTNDFLVQFYKVEATWAGQGKLGDTVNTDVYIRENKRLDW